MTEFTLKFGDDFTDYINEQVEEAVGNTDLSDHITNAMRHTDADDWFDMDKYDQSSEVEELEVGVNEVTNKVDALTSALVALVTALAKAGIVAEVKVADEPTGYTYQAV